MEGLDFIPLPARIGIVAAGILGILGYRALHRHSKMIRIPNFVLRDPTSPFYLAWTRIHTREN